MNKSKNKYKSRSIMLLGCFTIFCLSSIIILFSIYSMNKVRKESDFITQEILPAKIFSMKIETSLIDQETGIRAYIISENEVFLQSYYLGNKEMQQNYNLLSNLKKNGLNIDRINRLNQQMKFISNFFHEQVLLVENGKSYEAKLNLNKGKHLVDEFSVTDDLLLNEIETNINSSREKVANTQILHKCLLITLGIILIACNFIFFSYIRSNMHEEINKKNKTNEGLQKLISLQEEYIANISHELKTPLNVIFSGIQLFQMYCHKGSLDEKTESINRYLDSMKLNSYRLNKLINNIVDSSKIEAGFFKLNQSNNNIVEVVEEIVMSITNVTDIKGIHITFDTDIEEKIIACDPEKIERIVLNLISNAIKFSDEGDEIFVNFKDKNEFVEISVKDNGIGIKEKDLETIFNRFKQVDKSLSRNSEGSGIGLNLVKSIVELHGGSIYAESEFGKGSKFIVTIPSVKILKENILYNSKLSSSDEMIRVEFSDIYS